MLLLSIVLVAPSLGLADLLQSPQSSLAVEKTADFEGGAISRIEGKYLGKKLTYNILVRRGGEINDNTRVRITEDMGGMCGNLLGLTNPDGSLNNENIEITSEQGHAGTEITINDNCVITILGDAKAVVGNRFHIKVRLTPELAAGTNSLPNRVKAAVLGDDDEAEAVAELNLPVPNASPVEVEKTADFEGEAISRIEGKHLGKKLTYNILVRRSGEINDKTRVRITEDMGEMCWNLLGLRNPDGSLNNENIEITSEQGHVGTEITINDNCVITILGDAKAIVGNKFHIKVRLRPELTARTSNLPNRVNVNVLGQPGTPTETGVLGVLGILTLPVAPELATLAPATGPASGDIAPVVNVSPAADVAPVSGVGPAGGVAPALASAPAALPRAGEQPVNVALMAGIGLILGGMGWMLYRRRGSLKT